MIISPPYASKNWRPLMGFEEEQRRAYFRLRYPEEARPQFEVDGIDHPVCEISEGGIRVLLVEDAEQLADEVAGLLKLSEQAVQVEGRVLRRDEDELILVLSEGVPFSCMVQEQRRLLKEYPALFGRDD